jgi:hypothetical protein
VSELAKRANDYHAQVLSHARSAIESAWLAGEALNEAKKQIKHGDWLPWLEKNFSGSRQTADRYRALAANCPSLSNLDPNQSIDAALKALNESPPPLGAAAAVGWSRAARADPRHRHHRRTHRHAQQRGIRPARTRRDA